MRLVIISDTHNKHNEIQLPKGDILIHAGDLTGKGTLQEVEYSMKWLEKQSVNFKKVIWIAGNHDFYFENSPKEAKNSIPKETIYLENDYYVYDKVKFFGSPIQPFFYNWAFNKHRGSEIAKYWDIIPQDTDILITHGPCYGILDETISGYKTGCEDLLKKVYEIKPSIHICGHIHEARGIEKHNDILFINASVLNERYQHVNKSIVIDFDPITKKCEIIEQ